MAQTVTTAKLPEFSVGPDSQCQNHAAVIVSDATTFDPPARVIFAAGAGTLVLTDMSDVDATYTVPAGGVVNWMIVKKVKAASTATGIVRAW